MSDLSRQDLPRHKRMMKAIDNLSRIYPYPEYKDDSEIQKETPVMGIPEDIKEALEKDKK